jgi:hypothetical protein
MKQSLIILVFICLATVVLINRGNVRAKATHLTPPQDESVKINEAFLAHTTRGAGATVPAKLCSAVHELSFNWRETVVAPDNWNASTCQNFANSLGGTHYQLGCANKSSFSWGNKDGGLPEENECHW